MSKEEKIVQTAGREQLGDFAPMFAHLNLEENAKSGTWLEGKRLQAGVSEDELLSWIDGLK